MNYADTETKARHRRPRHVLSNVLIVAGIVAMLAGGGVLLYDRQSADEQAAIADEVVAPVTDDGTQGGDGAAQGDGATQGTVPGAGVVDFGRAQERTGCTAWLQIPSASISLPVMQASAADPEYWLRHSLSGRWTWSGTLFVDSRTTADARNALVFGHHMTATGGMLSNIFDTWQQGPFDARVAAGAVWTTGTGRHEAHALCALKVHETNQEVQRMDFADDGEFRDWLRDLVSQSGAHVADTDEVIDSATHAVVTVCCSQLRAGQPWRTVDVFVY